MPTIEDKINYIKICDSIIEMQEKKISLLEDKLEDRISRYHFNQKSDILKNFESEISKEKRKKNKYDDIKSRILYDITTNDSGFIEYVNKLPINKI